MATRSLIFFLLISGFTLTSVTGENTEFGRPLDRDLADMNKKEQVTHFKFYWHDVVSGSNATSVEVIPPIPKYNYTTEFGLVRIIDNALTMEPNLSSKLVGRAEGLYAATSQSEYDLLMVQSLAFFEGKYNGSSIVVLGRNVAFNETRELPVIGGSGVFRFAKGYAEIKTNFSDPTTRYAIIEYNLYVSHQ